MKIQAQTGMGEEKAKEREKVKKGKEGNMEGKKKIEEKTIPKV